MTIKEQSEEKFLDMIRGYTRDRVHRERERILHEITKFLKKCASSPHDDPNGCVGFCESFGCGTLRKIRHVVMGGESED